MKAAQQYGVDPRALLAFTKNENSNARNISPELNMANNFGGIKYVGQSGASDSGITSPEGGNYAAFKTPEEFFAALARNLSTGQYKDMYDQGNLAAVRREYVVGGAGPGTPQQEQNISNTVADYNRYRQQYPGNPVDTAPGGPNGNNTLYPTGSGGVVTGAEGGGVSPAIVSIVRQQIVDKAMQSVNTDHLAQLCEQFVEETVQSITGQRGSGVKQANGLNPANATQAFQLAQAQGLVTKDPQKGDLVYYPDASGNGHVAIYAGNGMQVSTQDAGGNLVHVEPVGANAQYVRVPGLPDDLSSGISALPHGATYAGSNQGQVATTSTPVPVKVVATDGAFLRTLGGGTSANVSPVTNVAPQVAALGAQFHGMDPRDIQAAVAAMNTTGPILAKQAEAALGPNAGPNEKAIAAQEATQKNIELATAWARVLQDIRTHTGDIAADEQKVADIVGGPLGANLKTQLGIMADQAATADQINMLTARKKTLEDAHADQTTTRQQQDQADQRSQTMVQWSQQDAANRLQDKQNVENDRYTQVQRDEQDRQRALQFQQQVQATDLQNKLTDTQKQQQSTIYQRTAQEQVQSATVKGAGTNEQAAAGAAVLATMHDQDLAQKDLNTKAIDAIQLQIREQAKKSNLDSYNLQTQTIAEQRVHENRMKQYTDEGTAAQRQAQADARAHQIALWQIQDTRAAEDKMYQNAIDSIDKEIAADQKIATEEADRLKAVQQLATLATSADDALGGAASHAIDIANAINGANPAGSPATGSQGQTYIRKLGGFANGTDFAPGGEAMVGENGPERVILPRGARVIPAPQTAAGVGAGSTTIVNLNLGDVSLMLSEADKADIHTYVQEKIRAAQRAGRNHMNALGVR
jgi:hypothetical protein